MIPEEYREFFTAAAGASGALIGLLFVAITVSPERAHHVDTRAEFRIRASAALLVFSNALLLSLAALVPGVSLGWWSVAGSVGLFAFAFATARSGVTEARRKPGAWRPFGLVAVLLLIAGFEVCAGVQLIHNNNALNAVRTLDYIVIADLTAGIARAWQLTSMRDTGVLASLRVLALGDDLTADSEHGTGGGDGTDGSDDTDGGGDGTRGGDDTGDDGPADGEDSPRPRTS